jgi:hypothetical protein
MSTTLELINAIASGDAAATEDAFQAAMAEKIGARLDDMRSDVAKTMFNKVDQQSEEPASEEEQVEQ